MGLGGSGTGVGAAMPSRSLDVCKVSRWFSCRREAFGLALAERWLENGGVEDRGLGDGGGEAR